MIQIFWENSVTAVRADGQVWSMYSTSVMPKKKEKFHSANWCEIDTVWYIIHQCGKELKGNKYSTIVVWIRYEIFCQCDAEYKEIFWVWCGINMKIPPGWCGIPMI